MNIDRADLVSVLRSRGSHARADWVERALPPLVDIDKNSALLDMLGIQADTMPPAPATHSG
jgi:hypothetical protein